MERLTRRQLLALPVALALFAIPALAADAKPETAASGRHYDLRKTVAPGDALAADPAQAAAIERWQASIPGVRIARDARTGALRSMVNLGGYLTGARQGGDIESLALAFVRQEIDLMGLAAEDLDDYEVTNIVPSPGSGLTHIYLRQRHAGLPVYGALLQINLKDDGRVLSVHNRFLPRIAAAVRGSEPAISVPEAVASLTAHLGVDPADLVDHSTDARLMYLPIRAGEARLVWNFQVETVGTDHWYDVTVDAVDGRVWTRVDWVAEGGDGSSYKVYETPVESPYHSVPPTPSDSRTTANEPAGGASPFGWHDTNGVAGAEATTTVGNNVHAYTDTNNDNSPDAGSSPDGGAGLDFVFPLDFTLAPSAYRPAAVTNLFYWNNIIHDIFDTYGFTAAAGNFQSNNYGGGGLGSDSVQAEAQDGGGTNNANFATPPDGLRPRMQMYIGSNPTPDVDGDLDNMVIVHEYGHGISNRLTGGPANTSCLDNDEQMGEGWSDFLGLALTHKATDTALTGRAVGTYLFGQGVGGAGIRPAKYTTDMLVNPYTYGDIPGLLIPHGVGFDWATMLWEMYWALIDEHGFNPDVYADWSTGGNNLALQLVLDGMKLQPCSPGFVDGRNAILAADVALTSGANQCLIWGAFAKRGLGDTADQGDTNNTADGVENFDLPSSCTYGSAGADVRVCATAGSHDQIISVGPAFATPPVTMTTAGEPANATVAFSPNPVPTVPNTTTLTLGNLGAVAAGNYDITVTGTDAALDTGNDTFSFTVDTASASPTTLTSPADDATGISTSAPLAWTAVAGIDSYDVEVDDNGDFSSPEFTATVGGTSTFANGLLALTEYFWRVRATNGCGGDWTSAFSFTTSAEYCATPTLAIPDGSPGTAINHVILIPPGGPTIVDLDIKLEVTHTYVGDLTFSLSNGGAPVVFYNRPGRTTTGFGCSGDNIDVTVNDEGPDGDVESQCSNLPATSGNRIGGDPASSTLLQAFDFSSLSATWTLTAQDFAGGDTGIVTKWCLLPTTADVIFSDGFESNDTSLWSATFP